MSYSYWPQGQQAWFGGQNYGSWEAYSTQQTSQSYPSSVQMGQTYTGFEQGQLMQSFNETNSALPPPPPPEESPPAKRPALSSQNSDTSLQVASQQGLLRAGVGFPRPAQPQVVTQESYSTSQAAIQSYQAYGSQPKLGSQQSYQNNQASGYSQGPKQKQTRFHNPNEGSENYQTWGTTGSHSFKRPAPVQGLLSTGASQTEGYGQSNFTSQPPKAKYSAYGNKITQSDSTPVYSTKSADGAKGGAMSIGDQIRVGYSIPNDAGEGAMNQKKLKNTNFSKQKLMAQYKNLQGSFKSSGTFLHDGKTVPGQGSKLKGEGDDNKLTSKQRWYLKAQQYGGVQNMKKSDKKPAAQIKKEERLRRQIQREYNLKSGAAKVRYEYPDSEMVPQDEEEMEEDAKVEHVEPAEPAVNAENPEEPEKVWEELPKNATVEERFARIKERLEQDKTHTSSGEAVQYLSFFSWHSGIKCTFQILKVRPCPKSVYRCDVFMDEWRLGSAEGNSKKVAKTAAFEDAVEALKKDTPEHIVKHYPKSQDDAEEVLKNQEIIQRGGDKDCVKISNYGNIQFWRKPGETMPLSEFIILEQMEATESTSNPKSILAQSSDFSRMLLEYHINSRYEDMNKEEIAAVRAAQVMRRQGEKVPKISAGLPTEDTEYLHMELNKKDDDGNKITPQKRIHMCKLYLEGVLLGEAEDAVQGLAKCKAAEQALACLRETNYTILNKKMDFDVSMGVQRAKVFTEHSGPLSEYSEYEGWGAKVMRKWGWTGGSLGKTSQPGIEMPVDVKDIWGTEGLGLREQAHNVENFHQRLQDYLNDFAMQEKMETLIFSPEFNKQERTDIHFMCKRLNLKCQTHTDKKNWMAYVIVSRRMSGQEIFKRLKEMGGKSQKYILKPPELAEFMGEDL